MKYLCTVFGLLALAVCQVHAQLELHNVFPEQAANTQIRDIRFVDRDFGIAVGFRTQSSTVFNGVIGITEDGGQTWEILTVAASLFFGVDIQAPDNIHVVGFHASNKAIVFHSTDKGKTWDQALLNGEGTPDIVSLYAVRYHDAETILAGGFNGAIVKSTDKGQTWEAVFEDQSWSIWQLQHRQGLYLAPAITAENNTNIYTMYASTDEGNSWMETGPTLPDGFGIESVEFAADGSLYGFGNQDGSYGIVQSVDNGATWIEAYTSEDTGSLKCAFAGPNGALYAGGENGKIVYRLVGKGWQETSMPDDHFIWNIDGIGDAVYFATSSGSLYRSVPTSTSVEAPNHKSSLHVLYDSTTQLLTVEGLDHSALYTLRISSVEGRSRDFPVGESGTLDVSGFNSGAYVYLLLHNGNVVLNGKFIRD